MRFYTGQLLAHIQNTIHQYNLAPFGKRIAYPANRDGLLEHFPDPAVRKSIEVDAFHRLRSVPGIGKVLALTILYEIHDVNRFERVQHFASYARLVNCAHESAGKKRLARLQRKHGKGKALSILAHKIGRAVYYILARGTVFAPETFLHS